MATLLPWLQIYNRTKAFVCCCIFNLPEKNVKSLTSCCVGIKPYSHRLLIAQIGGGWATEDEMVGWYHRLNGPDFEQTPADSEGQGSLECCGPWGRKVGHD